MGATLRCSFGVAPSQLVILPVNRVMTNQQPDANIGDHMPLVNIMPFGMCASEANPAVEAATAAAAGIPTPAPCVPATPNPWVPGSPTVLLGNLPSLNNDSKLLCLWAGVIQIVQPGELTVQIA